MIAGITLHFSWPALAAAIAGVLFALRRDWAHTILALAFTLFFLGIQ